MPKQAPVKGEAWVRRRDRFVCDIATASPTKVTVIERARLLVYEYKPDTFHRLFRPAKGAIQAGDLFER